MSSYYRCDGTRVLESSARGTHHALLIRRSVLALEYVRDGSDLVGSRSLARLETWPIVLRHFDVLT